MARVVERSGFRPRLVVSDLDGTLLGSDGRLSPRTVHVLRSLRAQGITVIAATGRAPRSAMARVGGLEVLDALVCSNGAIVHDPVADVTSSRHVIDADQLTATFSALTSALPDLSFCWELQDRYGWDDGFHAIGSVHEDTCPFGPASRPTARDQVSKLMILHPTIRGTELRDRIAPLLPAPLTLGCSGVPFVELTAVGVHKASTVERVAASFGWDAANAVAFGDNANDLELLVWAGLGVAVANATDEARAAADETIGHHDDGAVAEWLAARCL